MRNIGIYILLIAAVFYLIRIIEDNRPPYFNEIDDITLEKLNPGEALTFNYTTLVTGLRDNSDEYVTTKVVFDGVDYRKVGDYFVTLRATDVNGNSFDRNVNVSIVDTRPPYFDVPDIDLRMGEFDTVNWAYFLYSAFGIDYDEVPTISFTDNIDYETPGQYLVTITAADDQGNVGVSTFRVFIYDDTINRYQARLRKTNTFINSGLRELVELEASTVCGADFNHAADIALTRILYGIEFARMTPEELLNAEVLLYHYDILDLLDDIETGVLDYAAGAAACDQVAMDDAHLLWATALFNLRLIYNIDINWGDDYL